MASSVSIYRKIIRAILVGDATILALLGGKPNVFYLRSRDLQVPTTESTITYFDVGDRPDVTVPLHDRTLQIDIWTQDVETADSLAARIRALLDGKPPLVPSGEWNVAFLYFVGEREAPLEEGDIVNKTLEFRMAAYELV